MLWEYQPIFLITVTGRLLGQQVTSGGPTVLRLNVIMCVVLLTKSKVYIPFYVSIARINTAMMEVVAGDFFDK